MVLPGLRNKIIKPLKGQENAFYSVINAICNHFQLTEDELFSHNSKERYVYPRHITFYILKKYLLLSPETIASVFNKDRTTVSANIKRLKDLMETESSTMREVVSIEESIFS